MDCTTCARFEINCDKALTDDSYFCNEYLDLQKLHKMQLEVPVRGGTLTASSSGDPENPEEDWTEKHIICNTAIEAMLNKVED